MSLIAVFRNAQLLARENQWKIVGGNLARTGMGNTVDMTLSCFPKLMADAAACRVLMYFWAKASPKELIYVEKGDKSLSSSSTPAAELVDVSKQAMVARASSSYLKETNTKATVSAESTTGTNALDYGSKQPRNTERACKVFKHVVLCVWRAFCVPEARKDRLVLNESLEETYRREMIMRRAVEKVMHQGPASIADSQVVNAAKNPSMVSQQFGLGSSHDTKLSIPFSPSEFFWSA